MLGTFVINFAEQQRIIHSDKGASQKARKKYCIVL